MHKFRSFEIIKDLEIFFLKGEGSCHLTSTLLGKFDLR